jgi:hypothetical protein
MTADLAMAMGMAMGMATGMAAAELDKRAFVGKPAF